MQRGALIAGFIATCPMKRIILIVTPSAELGELISTSLRDAREFEGFHFTDPSDAVAFLAARRDCEAAIIETRIGEARTIELGHALRRIKRGLRLVLIARDRPGRGLDELQPWRLLRQPFLLPELFAVLGLTAPAVIDVDAPRGPTPAKPTWLDDAALASRTLERLTRTTSIQEAFILREFDLWASSGHFTRASLAEFKDMILNTMGYGEQFDLLRFMRLRGANAEHGVWAKLLLVNVILATIYDLDTPISEMRTQTNALADALSRPLLARPGAHQELRLPDTSGLTMTRRSADLARNLREAVDAWRRGVPRPGTEPLWESQPTRPEDGLEDVTPPSRRAFGDQGLERSSPPQPVPPPPPREPEGEEDEGPPAWTDVPEARLPDQRTEPVRDDDREIPAQPADPMPRPRRSGPETDREQEREPPAPAPAPTPRPRRPRPEREPEPSEDFLLGPDEAISADGGTLDAYGILYSCLLTPRFTTRALSGHLAALLQKDLPQICISFGWRLESVEVMYDCLQWLVRVPPTEAIAEAINRVRKRTSQHIFEEFPELLRENLSHDFWAPGFSVRAGAQPHSTAKIRAYVLKTRRGAGYDLLDSGSDFPSEEPPDDWSP